MATTIISTERDEYTGDVIRTHADGTRSVLEGLLQEQGYWVSDQRFVGADYRPILDERGNGICGTCGVPVEKPQGPWDGERERGGYSVHYGVGGANITGVRCAAHRSFVVIA